MLLEWHLLPHFLGVRGAGTIKMRHGMQWVGGAIVIWE